MCGVLIDLKKEVLPTRNASRYRQVPTRKSSIRPANHYVRRRSLQYSNHQLPLSNFSLIQGHYSLSF